MVPDRFRGALLPLALAASALAVPSAHAQVRSPGEYVHAGTLEVPLNKSQVVTADMAIAKAMIGNEEIADILPVTDRSLYVLGKSMGTTSLTLYDNAGRVISIMDIAVGPDVVGLRSQLGTLIPGQQIDASISNQSIVLTGMVTDPGAISRAVELARTYAGDKVVNLVSMGSSQQVMLEVRFAEVRKSSGVDLGVSGFGLSDGGTFDAVTGSGAQLIPGPNGAGVPNLLAITDTFGIFRKIFSIGSLNIEGILDALETKGMAKTLAQPTLLALSGERASFLAGGEFPVPVAQSGTGTANGTTAITVQFKPFGVSLGFTPTVLGDRTINLVVEPEVSQIDPTASLTLGNITIPGISTRRASTTLELRDGESFAIAGLLSEDYKTNISQLPVLGSLPIIGSLFRSTEFQKGETELLIVVTPRLVAPIKPNQVRLPTDAVENPTALESVLLGSTMQPKTLAPAAPATDYSADVSDREGAATASAAELEAIEESDYEF